MDVRNQASPPLVNICNVCLSTQYVVHKDHGGWQCSVTLDENISTFVPIMSWAGLAKAIYNGQTPWGSGQSRHLTSHGDVMLVILGILDKYCGLYMLHVSNTLLTSFSFCLGIFLGYFSARVLRSITVICQSKLGAYNMVLL